MAYQDLDSATQERVNNIAKRIGASPNSVMQAIDADINRTGNGLFTVIAWFERIESENQLRQGIAALASGITGGSQQQPPQTTQNPAPFTMGGVSANGGLAGMPTAPQLMAGGNLVAGVNARYSAIFGDKQRAYASANNGVIQAQDLINAKQSAISDSERQRDFFASEVALWRGRHKGCGPLSRYGCGDVDSNEARNLTQLNNKENEINSLRSELAAMQTNFNSFLQSQLTVAKKDLVDAYAAYNTDVSGAISQERAAQETIAQAAAAAQNTKNQNDPAYWAAKNEADRIEREQAAQNAVLTANAKLAEAQQASAAKLAETEAANKKQLHTMVLAGLVLVAVVIISFVGYKIVK